ncbi:MAG: type IV pili methyl-accepting chemotaxis transducer N-terminal domain-containing protein [Burkholderiales bacterium]|nr:type IV pili methyl-accepting chemotaxis transducer N-terminal domain-containing protein [Burkholderiales bacterium]
MSHPRHWSLGSKLALIGIPFLLLALLSIALTLWVSWKLDGGAAAVNEAGRMRMQAYRMALAVGTGETGALPKYVEEFEGSLATLRHGDLERPLFVPWDDAVRQRFAAVERNWVQFHRNWTSTPSSDVSALRDDTAAFASGIDAFVASIERHMSRWTSLLHLLQLAMMVSAVVGAVLLLYMGYLFVLEPVGHLKEATERLQRGDFGARVQRVTTDEFGSLAECFNDMAGNLQSMYRDLEARVAEKTSELEEKRERLEALYDVTALAAKAVTLKELANGFAERIGRVSRADGVALRWSDEANQRFLLLASEGLPESMADDEACVRSGQCYCGTLETAQEVRVVSIAAMRTTARRHCADAGYATLVSIPVRLHERLMGEVNLFYHAQVTMSPAERSLLEALTAHLAGAMENLRLNALAREAAVAQERTFIARELHDSIAQSLAFLKIQVQLMRDALGSGDGERVQRVLEEIDTGVRESYGDVRELLLHFRTRVHGEDIGPALETTLRKFEHQSGLKATMQMQGHGMPLAPDLQVQVLHIVQEALSNVRKHAQAARVWLTVSQLPQWRFEVRDDGIGFMPDAGASDETHVGLRIMAERAEKIGGTLDVVSTPGRGTSIVLTLPQRIGLAAAASPPVAETVSR